MCQIILSIPDEVLYDTIMSHEQVSRCEFFSVNSDLL